MNNFFQGYVMMAVQASLAILGMLCARLLLKRLPKRITCLLWLVVIFRLLCPVALEGPIPAFWQESADGRQAQVQEAQVQNVQVQRSEVQKVDGQQAQEGKQNASKPDSANLLLQAESGERFANIDSVFESQPDKRLIFVSVLCILWLVGVLICLFLHAKQYLVMKRRLAQATPYITWKQMPVKKSDVPFTPFSFGVVRPCIYVPLDFSIEPKLGETETVVLEHERIHIRSCDLIVKSLYRLAICVHWWNPLVWVGASLLQKDIEMACDEGVLRSLQAIDKAEYADILLQFSAKRSGILLPVAFGESNTQERIKNILQKKKLPIGLSAVGIVAAVCIAVLLGTRPHAVTEGAEHNDGQEEVMLDTQQKGLNAEGGTEKGTEQDTEKDTKTDTKLDTKTDVEPDVKIDTKEEPLVEVPLEQVLNIFKADLNRDGELDHVVLSVENIPEFENAEEMIQIGAPVYVRVYDGKALDEAYAPDALGMTGGYNQNNGIIWERMLSKAHVGNGFVYLCNRLGKAYLLTGYASCFQGVWEYCYEVDECTPDTKDVVVVEQRSLSIGATVPENIFPVEEMYSYTKELDTWIDGATLLVDLDIDREPKLNTDGTLQGSAVDIWQGLEMQVDQLAFELEQMGANTTNIPKKIPVTDMEHLKAALQSMNSRYAAWGAYILQNQTNP